MFGKKKNTFGDAGYKMKEMFEVDKLVVANLQIISSDYTSFGPMIETTQQKYIFEKIITKNELKYREIFTGFIASNIEESKNKVIIKQFNLPYVYKPKNLTDYIPETKGKEIPKLSLLWALNDINYSKNKENVKKLKKDKTLYY